MKVFFSSLLAFVALTFCFNASAQDIIYTIRGEINHQTTALDSISIENLTKQSSFGFGELPELDDYRINLTQNKFWGSTSVYDLTYDNSLYLHENRPGLVSVGYNGQTATNASITLYNVNGQKLLAKNDLTLDMGSLVEVEINQAGVYLLYINTPRETRTFKAIGASKSGQLAIALQSNSATPLKSGQLYHIDNQTQSGDNIKIRVFKNNYVAEPIEIRVEKDTSLVFALDSLTAPTVQTLEASDILMNSATLNGTILNNGNSSIIEHGFYWSATNENPGEADNKIIVDGTTGSLSANLSGLEHATTYYVRAYAINAIGTSYGEQISFITLDSISICDALDNCNLTFTHSGNGEWFAETEVSFYGGSSAQSGTIDNNQQSTVETTVKGPGILSFYWKVSSQSGYDKLNFYIGSTLKDDISGDVDWQLKEFDIQEGTYTIKWKYYKNYGYSDGHDCGWLDKVVFTPVEPTIPIVTTAGITDIFQTTSRSGGEVTSSNYAAVTARGLCWNTTEDPTIADSKTTNGTGIGTFTSTITGLSANTTYYVRAYATNSQGTAYGEQVSFTTMEHIPICNAVDNCDLTFNMEGSDADWFGQTAVSYHGGSSAQSGLIGFRQKSILSTNVTSPGILSFYWKASTEERDPLTLYIEGSTGGHIYGNTDWQYKEYKILEGKHSLKWHYSNYSNREGYVWVDKIEFTPMETTLPSVKTINITNITRTTATSKIELTSLGFAPTTAGICWNTTGNPTISDNKTENHYSSPSNGSFSFMTELTLNTTYYVRAYATNSKGTVYGEQKSFTTLRNLPICDDLDNCDLIFFMKGDADWFAQTKDSCYGGSCVQSGSIGQYDQSTLETTVTGPGFLSFYWKVSSGKNNDYLNFYLGNTLIDKISGIVDWQLKEYEIPEGNHTLRWSYEKNVYFIYGLNCGRLDKIVFSTDKTTLPAVTTANITKTTLTSANSGGEITSSGNTIVTARGICWNTTGSPTIADSKTTEGTGSGSFTSSINGLTANTTYYVRAYGTNSQGTAYGNQIIFKTHKIGEVWWQKDTITKVVEVTNPATGRTWMDRNLGASRAATSSTDENAYGDLYQWGRAADGHQKRNSLNTETISSSDIPGHGNFILSYSSTGRDWRRPKNTNLWQGLNGINNPCPSGYRLPTEAEWRNEYMSWSSKNTTGAFESPLKLPLAGHRSYQELINVGSCAYYWSSTVDAEDFFCRYLNFSSSRTYTIGETRAEGLSVRCIKD